MRKKYISILSVKHSSKYILSITFNDGKSSNVDFAEFLTASSNPSVKKYLKLTLFKKFRIENGDLMWGDFDLIFPIQDLYNNTIVKNKASKTTGVP